MDRLFWRRSEYSLLALGMLALVVSCVSAGTPRLSKQVAEKVVEGETTKGEIAGLLGKPEQMLRLDKKSLENYIRRVSLEKPPDIVFPEGQYEVWTYSKWSDLEGPVFLPGRESAKFCIFIFDSDDIYVEKFFATESKIGF